MKFGALNLTVFFEIDFIMSVRNYNQEMITGINQLKQLRDSVASQIETEQALCNKLKDEIGALSERM